MWRMPYEHWLDTACIVLVVQELLYVWLSSSVDEDDIWPQGESQIIIQSG